MPATAGCIEDTTSAHSRAHAHARITHRGVLCAVLCRKVQGRSLDKRANRNSTRTRIAHREHTHTHVIHSVNPSHYSLCRARIFVAAAVFAQQHKCVSSRRFPCCRAHHARPTATKEASSAAARQKGTGCMAVPRGEQAVHQDRRQNGPCPSRAPCSRLNRDTKYRRAHRAGERS